MATRAGAVEAEVAPPVKTLRLKSYYGCLSSEARATIEADIASIEARCEAVPSMDTTPQVVALGHRVHPTEWNTFRAAYPTTPAGRHAFNTQVRYLFRVAASERRSNVR